MKLDKETQAKKLADAQRLVTEGKSRRTIYKVLHKKYGQSVGKDTFSRLFKEKVAGIEKKTKYYVGGYKKPTTWRAKQYNALVEGYMLPWEARELLSRLKNRSGAATLKEMIKDRVALHDRFVRTVAQDRSATGLNKKWRAYVNKWYSTTAVKYEVRYESWVRRQGNKPVRRRELKDLIWRWFGYHKGKLPEDQQYYSPTSPRTARRKQQKPYKADKGQIEQWIKELRTRISNPDTPPDDRDRFRNQMDNLRRSIE